MRCLIVEDSRLARKELISLLKEFPQIIIEAEAESVDQAYDLLNTKQIDLIFLDINMPGKNGFQLLEMLDNPPRVIFTTAYDEFAIKSFEYNTLDYLLKPIKPDSLSRAIQKAEEYFATKISPKDTSKLKRVFLKDGEKCWLVDFSDIVVFESEGNYTRVYFDNNRPLIYKSLNAIEEKIDKSVFFRVNRRQIINLDYIKNIKTGLGNSLKITLKNDIMVEVSRRNAQQLKELLSF